MSIYLRKKGKYIYSFQTIFNVYFSHGNNNEAPMPLLTVLTCRHKCEVSQAELWYLRLEMRGEREPKMRFIIPSPLHSPQLALAELIPCFDSQAATQNIISTSVASSFPFSNFTEMMGPLGLLGWNDLWVSQLINTILPNVFHVKSTRMHHLDKRRLGLECCFGLIWISLTVTMHIFTEKWICLLKCEVMSWTVYFHRTPGPLDCKGDGDVIVKVRINVYSISLWRR